jgi:hypothetical protein
VDESIRMPSDDFPAIAMNMVISELVGNYEDFLSNEAAIRAQYPWADRFVLGYPLPSWQRALTWSQDQKERFITSIWAGIDIGSYLLNDAWSFTDERTHEGLGIYREFSNVVLDGQQRMQTIQDFLDSRFAVPDAQGVPRLWRDLPRVERRRFENRHFARCAVQCWGEPQLRRIYNLRAFGGTPHQPGEVA